MNIILIDQYNKVGGGQTVLLQIIKVLKQEGHSVSVLLPSGGEIEKYIDYDIKLYDLKGLDVGPKKDIYFYLKFIWSILYFFKYYAILNNNQVVYVNGPRCFIHAAIASLFIRKKYYYHVHLLHKGFEKKTLSFISKLNSTKKIVVNSDFVLKDLKSSINLNKLYLLENSLSEAFSILKYINRFEVDNRFNCAVIGRISEEKGQHIIGEIASCFPNIMFYFIGDYDFSTRDYLQSLKKKNISNIIFYGKSSDVIKTINELAINISIVPSTWQEPFGLVAIESMACSCVTIVSDKGELPNIAKKTGAYVFKTTAELKILMSEILEMDNAKLTVMSNEQFSLTKSHYDNLRFSKEFCKLIGDPTV